jgi:hypothetical protein
MKNIGENINDIYSNINEQMYQKFSLNYFNVKGYIRNNIPDIISVCRLQNGFILFDERFIRGKDYNNYFQQYKDNL